MKVGYLAHLLNVFVRDAEQVLLKDKTYKGSWLKRGGVGAFMMLARKWDRLEGAMEANGYDILSALAKESPTARDGLLDDVQDLRRYLALVEAQLMALRDPTWEGITHDDALIKTASLREALDARPS